MSWSAPSRSVSGGVVIFGAVVSILGLTACPRGGSKRPERVQMAPWQVAVETSGAGGFDAVAVARDGRVAATFRASAAASLGGTELSSPVGGAAVVMLAPGGAPVWTRAMSAQPGPIAVAGEQVVVAVGGTGAIELDMLSVALRGEPGAAVVGLAATDGAERWVAGIGSTDWVVVRGLTAMPDGEIVAVGSFAGTLRAGTKVVTSGGGSDGFVLRLAPDGELRWLMRMGGARADAVTTVAAAPDGLVIGGTFTGDADLRSLQLQPIEPTAVSGDAFVARLTDDGAVSWAQSFGGDQDDAVAGVAVTGAGVIGVAATLRGDVLIDGRVVSTRGLADAAVITFDLSGHRRAVALIGGDDYDTAAGLAALGDDLVVAASYAGRVFLGDTRLDGDGGDGAVIAVLDAAGTAIRVHDLAGPGRETVSSLAAVPGGFAASVRHTAGLSVDAATLPAPADPYGGSALLFRGE